LIFGFVTQLKVSINAVDVNPMPGHMERIGALFKFTPSPEPELTFLLTLIAEPIFHLIAAIC
jgi:hypothetical protein